MKPKIHIPEPCNEDWSKMKIGLRSRFCQSCSKDVMDFTKMSREEILQYLLMNRNSRVCGHIRPTQLDFTTNDYLNSIHTISKTNKNRNLGFYLLTLGAMISAGAISETFAHPVPSKDAISIVEMVEDSTKSKGCDKGPSTPPPHVGGIKMEAPIGGKMILESDTSDEMIDGEVETTLGEVVEERETIFVSAEVMPEFPGGIDSLMQFVKDNISLENIETPGRVLVRFVVTKEGKLRDYMFFRPGESTEAMRDEATRILNLMPLWIPGKSGGKAVDVRFMLPIVFKE